MFKSLLATTIVLILATLFLAGAAQAGCGKHHGFSNQSFSASYRAKKARRARLARLARQRAIAKKKAAARRQAIAQRRALAAKKARIAAAKAKKAAEQKLAQLKAQEQKTAEAITDEQEILDKPVSVAALAGANTLNIDDTDSSAQETAQSDVGVSEKEVSCKKYIPAAGLTITVPCNS